MRASFAKMHWYDIGMYTGGIVTFPLAAYFIYKDLKKAPQLKKIERKTFAEFKAMCDTNIQTTCAERLTNVVASYIVYPFHLVESSSETAARAFSYSCAIFVGTAATAICTVAGAVAWPITLPCGNHIYFL